MKNKILLSVMCLLAVLSLQAQTNGRYIEVTGTSEIEIVPDKIHYLIEIREYFEEEFDGKSKPEEYRTKVSLSEIEQGLRENLDKAGIPQNAAKCYSDTRNRRLLAAARAGLFGFQEV